ncbi:MAG: DUF262 domain-containing protein [Candidatus Nanopelagicaceae bacterium]|nr:DUF262 domain-containing protein [Candidatus Nanopelagicaceae bacterium]
MDTPLNASATTAGSLMSSSTFLVPPYQREFAWTVDEVGEFWSDLRDGLEDQAYFLGLIILTDEDGTKQVVDGQQRILTLSILAAVLRQAALAEGRKALADRLRSDFLESIDYATDANHPRVVLSDETDNATFHQIIFAPDALEPGLRYGDESLSPELISAHKELTQRLEVDLKNDPFKRLGIWADFLTNRLYFAVFVHPDPSSAYQVFEVINTRGRELTTGDLLKNYVLKLTDTQHRLERYVEWQKLSEDLNSVEPGAFVQFIRHVAMLKAGYVLPRDLYDYISGRTSATMKMNQTPPSVDELMISLREWTPFYLQLVDQGLEGPSEPDWLQVFAAVSELGVTSVRPILMAISKAKDPTEGMRALLRLLVHRIVVGNLSTGSVERRFAETARKIFERGSWKEALKELKDLDSNAGEFEEQLQKRSLNKGVLTFLRRSILQSSITPLPIGTLHLIRPKRALEWTEFPEDQFTYWGSTIGNTFLANTERRPRGTVTWRGFIETLLRDPSDGERPSQLKKYRKWNAEAVAREGTRLSKEAVRVWYSSRLNSNDR